VEPFALFETKFRADHLGAARGTSARAAQIVVVNGIQKALKIIARMFVRPGTPVAIEDPCPRGALSTFESYGAEFANGSYYVVLHEHPLFAGTGLKKDSIFGDSGLNTGKGKNGMASA
jgi:hypothetical protein